MAVPDDYSHERARKCPIRAGGTLIPTGWDDDAINANPAWLTLPDSRWISAAATGPNGTYVDKMCWSTSSSN